MPAAARLPIGACVGLQLIRAHRVQRAAGSRRLDSGETLFADNDDEEGSASASSAAIFSQLGAANDGRSTIVSALGTYMDIPITQTPSLVEAVASARAELCRADVSSLVFRQQVHCSSRSPSV